MKKWQIKGRKKVFQRPIFSIDELHCTLPHKNVEHNFTVMETYDWINVVALTEDKRFIMVRQHRLGTDELTLETPAGVIEKGEDPRKAAERELLEETGYQAGSFTHLKDLKANPAIMSTTIHFYLAEDCRPVSEQNLDDTEDIELAFFNEDQILQMIDSGEIDHSIIITAFSLYFFQNQGSINSK